MEALTSMVCGRCAAVGRRDARSRRHDVSFEKPTPHCVKREQGISESSQRPKSRGRFFI